MSALTRSEPSYGRSMLRLPPAGVAWHRSLSLRTWVFHPNTRKHNSLLGPCFKTGAMKSFRQHAEHADGVSLCQMIRESTLQVDVLAQPPGSANFLAEARVSHFPQSGLPYATGGYNSHPREGNPPSSCLSPATGRTDVDMPNSKVPPSSLAAKHSVTVTSPCVLHRFWLAE